MGLNPPPVRLFGEFGEVAPQAFRKWENPSTERTAVKKPGTWLLTNEPGNFHTARYLASSYSDTAGIDVFDAGQICQMDSV